MIAGNAALNDQALITLSWLLEQDDPRLAPDAVWLSGKPAVYEHLRDMGALSLASDMASDIVCKDCCHETIHPEVHSCTEDISVPYRGYCQGCGWIPLTREQTHFWQAQPIKIARWLGAALKLTPHYVVEPIIEGVLWRLGEIEHRRKRRTLFFGRRLMASAAEVNTKLSELVAPGAEVIITTSETGQRCNSALSGRLVVPLRAVAHIRKAGIVIENLETYLIGPGPVETSNETSLRLMHKQRVALINGEKHKLSPRLYGFLKILEDADGDEVHKRHIAEGLGIEASTFRIADIVKRHKPVSEAFVDKDGNGNYWLKPDFVILDRR